MRRERRVKLPPLGSISCFCRRGYVYDRVHRFARDSDGKLLRRKERECLEELGEDSPKLTKGCWLSDRDFGNNIRAPIAERVWDKCLSCERYIRFYARARELVIEGVNWHEAVMTATKEGYGEMTFDDERVNAG